MRSSRLLLATATIAFIAGSGAAFAQGNGLSTGRTVQGTPGFGVPDSIIMVVPTSSMPPFVAFQPTDPLQALTIPTALAFAGMPDAVALMREMNDMVARSQRMLVEPDWIGSERTIDAALPGMEPPHGTMQSVARGVIVTSVSDGQGTCTRRITYDGTAAPKVELTATKGASCDTLSPGPMQTKPVQMPSPATRPTTAHTWTISSPTYARSDEQPPLRG